MQNDNNKRVSVAAATAAARQQDDAPGHVKIGEPGHTHDGKPEQHKPVHPNPVYNRDGGEPPAPLVNQTYHAPNGQPSLLHHRLSIFAADDVDHLVMKGKTYGDSWIKRGGVGAFMVAARKWDRLENMAAEHGYDIFAADKAHPHHEAEAFAEQVADLRRYLLLWELELRGRR